MIEELSKELEESIAKLKSYEDCKVDTFSEKIELTIAAEVAKN